MDVEDNEIRRLIFIVMDEILTLEEKKYLNRTCNYLASLGMKEGNLGFELENDAYDLSMDDIEWSYFTHFENNYRAETPDGLIPIIKKIMNRIILDGVYESPEVDAVNYQKIEIEIDCVTKDLTVIHWYSFYDRGETNSVEYESEEDKDRMDNWMEEELSDFEMPDDGILTLSYNGGGDSGYLESSFDQTSDSVPTSIENWCYKQLENHFGGWENNEGADGQFVFNFNNSTVEILHTYNVEDTISKTLFEENFSL